MLCCDFSSVNGIIREYINEGNATTQPELIYDLFYTFAEKNDDFDFDNAQINRWIKGLAAVSPKIAEFYQHKPLLIHKSINESFFSLCRL